MKPWKLGSGWIAVGALLPIGLVWAQGAGVPAVKAPVVPPVAVPATGGDFPTVDPDTLPVKPAPATGGDFPTVDPDTLPVKPVPSVVKLPPRPFVWKQMSFALPAAIKIYEGDCVNQDGQPVKAWYADVNYGDRSIAAKSLLTDAKIGREATSSMAKKVGAYVAVNGGYFDIGHTPSASNSELISGGQVLARNVASVGKDDAFGYVTRGVFGVRADRSLDTTWIGHVGDEIYSYPRPLSAAKGKTTPPSATEPAGGRPWKNITEAIGGGPMLVHAGAIDMTGKAEHWGAGHTLARHPRTAIGSTAQGHIILLVGDGRKPDYSMGFTLPELAQTMKDLGCTDALNLDGGGSSTFVVLGKALNRMSDGRERNVTTAFAIVPAVK